MPAMPPRRTLTWFLIILLINFLVFRFLVPRGEAATTVPYTLFREQVTKRNVASIYSRADRITGKFRSAITYPTAADSASATGAPKKVTTFGTTLPSFVGSGLEDLLLANGVEIRAEPIEDSGSPLNTLLFGFGPSILLIVFYVWLFRRAAIRRRLPTFALSPTPVRRSTGPAFGAACGSSSPLRTGRCSSATCRPVPRRARPRRSSPSRPMRG